MAGVGEPVTISDPADPRVGDYVDLSDPDLRRRVEEGDGFFVAESALVIRRLLTSPCRVRSVLVTPHQHAALADVLDPLAAPVYVAPPALLRRVVGFDLHRGAVAAADRFPLPDPDDLLATATRVAVLEELNDHENLGVIFRNAAGLGLDALLLGPRCADPFYRRCVRVSVGHVLTVPFTRLEPWPQALDRVRSAGFTLAALTPDPSATPLAAFRPGPDDRVALLLGAEGPGLTPEVLATADIRLRIPMQRGVDSLNVASAAAVAFHHLGPGRSTSDQPPAPQ